VSVGVRGPGQARGVARNLAVSRLGQP
jgi:hypothetical protein